MKQSVSRNLESTNLYENAFLFRNCIGIWGAMAMTAKRGLSQLDKKIIAVLLTPILVFALLILLFTPIIPVQVTTTETRTIKLLSYYKVQHADNDSDYVNVTNFDTVGGTYTVIINKTSYERRTVEDTTEQSMFIAARNSGIFIVPQSWSYFTYEVTVPTKQESYNVTSTELKSIINIIENP
jgi:hypothetical protein